MKIISIVFLLLALKNYAQWQPDIRLTNNASESYTSNNNATWIASIGNIIHVVWYDSRDGNDEIYYKRSSDSGVSWGIDTRLTNNAAVSWFPSLAVFDSSITASVHIVWQDTRDSNNAEIYYKRSTDGGISWGTDVRLTNNNSSSQNPSIAMSGSGSQALVHVIWYDFRDGNYEIYYKRSTNAGINWEPDLRLTNNIAPSLFPAIRVSGSTLHVVWHDVRDGNYEIYYKRSSDGGSSWGADTRLTNNSTASLFPSLTIPGSGSPAPVHIVWYDNRDGNDEIYYKRSLDGGISWENDIRLTNNAASSGNPTILTSGFGTAAPLHIVWQDFRNGNYEIYYKRSLDGGTSWETDTRLTNITGLSIMPSIAISGQVVNVVWNDTRDGNYEIYYKRDPTGNPVGIQTISNEMPDKFELSQNYPNPFNPMTNINFSIPRAGYVKLVVFDPLGKGVAELVNGQYTPGSYKVDFDASQLSSGTYFYRLEADGFTYVKKMVLIK